MNHDKIDEVIDKYQGDQSSLIQILLDIQHENRWLSKEVFERVSEKLDIPLNTIYHIATFYRTFSLLPRGRHQGTICLGTACHVRGGAKILDRTEHVLGIKAGETTADMKFSLETVNCLGCCALGPVMVIDGKYHGKVVSAEVDDILGSCD